MPVYTSLGTYLCYTNVSVVLGIVRPLRLVGKGCFMGVGLQRVRVYGLGFRDLDKAAHERFTTRLAEFGEG